MVRAQSSGTGPERKMWTILRKLGYKNFLTNYPLKLSCRAYPICPDIIFLKEKVVVEVAGQYWHKPSAHNNRTLRMAKDEAKKNCLTNNGYTYLEFSDVEVNAAYKYFKDNTKLKYKAAYDKIVAEVKATLE